MAKKPPSQKSADQPEDAVTATILRWWKWGQENPQVLTVAGIVLVLSVGAGVYYYNYQQNIRQQAAREFEQIQQTLLSGNTQNAITEIQTYLDRFEGTPHAIEARIALAELHLDQDRPDEAVAALEPATRDLSEPLSRQAGFLLAAAHEQAGRIDEAEALYLRIAEEAELDFQIREALADAALLRARREDFAGAADLYERVLATYEGSDGEQATSGTSNRQIYQLRLSEMQAAQEDG